jgi:hypothetical protein
MIRSRCDRMGWDGMGCIGCGGTMYLFYHASDPIRFDCIQSYDSACDSNDSSLCLCSPVLPPLPRLSYALAGYTRGLLLLVLVLVLLVSFTLTSFAHHTHGSSVALHFFPFPPFPSLPAPPFIPPQVPQPSISHHSLGFEERENKFRLL